MSTTTELYKERLREMNCPEEYLELLARRMHKENPDACPYELSDERFFHILRAKVKQIKEQLDQVLLDNSWMEAL